MSVLKHAICLVLALPGCSGTNAGSRVSIDLQGVVPARCVLDMPTTIDLGDLQQGGQISAPFAAGCNIPMALTLQALRGALTLNDNAVTGPAFAASVPYRLSIRGSGTALTCEPKNLAASGTCRATFPATTSPQALELDIAWSDPTTPLAAGSYSDRVTIEVGPVW